jgi:hypothetical protein
MRHVLPRLVVVTLLALGLVGMHHLVVVACHHAGVTSAAASHQAHGAPLESPLAGVQEAPAEPPSPAGIVGAAATCLAILLMVMSLVIPRVVERVRRWSLPRLEPSTPARMQTIHRPPDLAVLSISRT